MRNPIIPWPDITSLRCHAEDDELARPVSWDLTIDSITVVGLSPSSKFETAIGLERLIRRDAQPLPACGERFATSQRRHLI
jgi:hypothetical protein